MKRKAVLTAVVLALIMLFSQFAYAGSLSIVKTVPSDGESGKQPSNMAVKIIFNEDMSSKSNDDLNSACIKITDSDGGLQEYELIHHDKYPTELWCVLKNDLEANTEYTVTVSAGVKATSGNMLGSSYSFSFSTRDTKKDNKISIFLTMGMMVVMILATSGAARKQAQSDRASGSKKTVEKVSQADPYRLAKEQNISVDEAKAIIAKEKAKVERKNASSEKARARLEKEEAEKEAEIQKRLQEIHDASVYKVKRNGSMREHGAKLPKAIEKKFAARKKSKKK